jgi:hypothetical protein
MTHVVALPLRTNLSSGCNATRAEAPRLIDKRASPLASSSRPLRTRTRRAPARDPIPPAFCIAVKAVATGSLSPSMRCGADGSGVCRSPSPVVGDVIRRIRSETAGALESIAFARNGRDEVRHAAGGRGSVCVEGAMPVPRFGLIDSVGRRSTGIGGAGEVAPLRTGCVPPVGASVDSCGGAELGQEARRERAVCDAVAVTMSGKSCSASSSTRNRASTCSAALSVSSRGRVDGLGGPQGAQRVELGRVGSARAGRRRRAARGRHARWRGC